MNTANFWSEAKRRRNLYFLWWLAWVPAGGIVVIAYQFFGGDPPFPLMAALLFSWWAAWIFIALRVRKLLCPQCGKPAFRNPYFFMRNAHCRHCGYRQATA
ncbi:MAG TPA: hypothetical protein VIY48_09870 [Candidatus Paceibacterota bacterium]|jgi:hypothetical protein|uniref:hypothetical protein n=1 Tax=Rhodanobacter soli TaxID=590609 RepID=UPI002F8B7697